MYLFYFLFLSFFSRYPGRSRRMSISRLSKSMTKQTHIHRGCTLRRKLFRLATRVDGPRTKQRKRRKKYGCCAWVGLKEDRRTEWTTTTSSSRLSNVKVSIELKSGELFLLVPISAPSGTTLASALASLDVKFSLASFVCLLCSQLVCHAMPSIQGRKVGGRFFLTFFLPLCVCSQGLPIPECQTLFFFLVF